MDRRVFLRAGVLVTGAPFFNRGRFALFAGETADYSVRTIDLVRRSLVLDMLGLLTLDYRKVRRWHADPSTFGPRDVARLRSTGITVLHPAVGFNRGDIHALSLRDVNGWNAFLAAHPEHFLRIDTTADIDRAKRDGKIGILLGQQNSAHLRSLDDVDAFHALGQRVSQLSYYRNRIGCGCYDTPDDGLSAFGVRVIERMNAVGMAIDLSHCGDRTTLEAIEASRTPILFTHSNCRALANHPRCKTDEAIRRLAARGGVMGVTMVRPFVGAGTLDDVLNHIDHIVRLAGMEHVGIGSDVDFTGRDRTRTPHKYDLDDVQYAHKIHGIAEGLLRRGYSETQVALCLGGNFQRALTEIYARARMPLASSHT